MEMTPISPPEQEMFVCQTCGDVGFTNAFVYCVKCLEFVIHRYCLNVIPKTFTEHVIWHCESCKSTVQNQVTSPEIISLQSHTKKAKKDIDPIWRENENSSSDSDSSCSSSNLIEFDEREARDILQNHQNGDIIDDVIIGDHPPITRKMYREIASILEERKELIFHHIPKKKRTNRKNIAAFLVAKKKEHNVQDYYYRHARPIIDPIWRGSFNVVGGDYDDLFEGLVGHLSEKACVKVYEEANLMPSLLHLEMQSKTLLWPKSLQNCEPSDDHIALYFFPDSINERAFDGLVLEMMDDELAMRATSKNAELLIFTSTMLPSLLRRFRGKYYLWGVFRGK